MEHNAKRSRITGTDQTINAASPFVCNSSMDILNDDCLLQIFGYLSISDRIRLERVNKRWQSISQGSWRSFKYLSFTRKSWGYFDRMQVTTHILMKVLDRCAKCIIQLDMSDCKILAENFYLGYALERCHNLTSVIFNSFNLNSQLLGILILHCGSIEEFSIGEASFAVRDFLIQRTILSTYSNLKILKFQKHKLAGWCLNAVTNTLEELHLDYCYKLDLNHISNIIPDLRKLRTLSLRGSLNYCFDKSYLNFVGLTNIKVLDISSNSKFIDDKCLFRIFESCKNLQSLDLSHNYKITDEGLGTIATVNLEHLYIDSLWHITGSSLTDLPSLKSLSCRDCYKLNGNLLDPILRTSNTLEFLDLSNCPKISGDLIAAINSTIDSRENDIVLIIISKLTDMGSVDVTSKKLRLMNEYFKNR